MSGAGGAGGSGALMRCRREWRTVRPLGKTVWQFLKKRNIYLALDPVVPLCGTYPKEEKLYVQTRTMRNNDSNWIISPNWKQHKYGSTGEFIHVMSQIP